MKLKQIIYAFTLAIIVIAAGAGCRKSQFNINQNTNSPTDSTVTYDVVLPAALHASGSIIGTQWAVQQRWMGFWSRSGTYAPNATEESYEITQSFGNGIWNNCYDNNYDYQIIISKAAKANAGFYEGIARIMKAHNYQLLVDVYGNVPYSEALKGGGNPTPAYDKGLDIYKDLFRQVDTAIQLIKNADVTAAPNKDIATNDIIFGADKGKWVRFANTLKLRWLIHCSGVAAINKTTELATITAEGSGFLGLGEDVMVQPGYASDKPNPFYNNYIRNTAGAQTQGNIYNGANEWGIGYYEYNGDPREGRFYTAGAKGFKGVAYGLPPTDENKAANLASIGIAAGKANTSAQNIMIAAESYFLQAEARQRGWITSGPTVVALTNSGISESFRYTGATLGTYITGNAGYADVDAAAPSRTPATAAGTQPVGGLFTIISQKWFALNAINTLEVWTDFRRVDYKEVVTASAVTDHFVYGQAVAYPAGPTISVYPQNTSTKIPVRFLYPQTEYNYNSANVSAEGTVDRYTKIFWDIN